MRVESCGFVAFVVLLYYLPKTRPLIPLLYHSGKVCSHAEQSENLAPAPMFSFLPMVPIIIIGRGMYLFSSRRSETPLAYATKPPRVGQACRGAISEILKNLCSVLVTYVLGDIMSISYLKIASAQAHGEKGSIFPLFRGGKCIMERFQTNTVE